MKFDLFARRNVFIALTVLFIQSTSHAKSEGPIIIGDLNSYGGLASAFTEPYKAGVKMAIDEINASGGLLGRQLTLVSRDDKLDPAEARKAALDLLTNEKADFLIGGIEGGICDNIAAIANEKKKLYVSAGCLTEPLTIQHATRYVARGGSINTVIIRAMAQYAVKQHPDVTKWAVISPNSQFGREATDLFKSEVKHLNPKAKFVKELFPQQGTQDFTTQITALRGSGAQGLFASIWGGDSITFSKQAKGLKLFDKIKYISVGAGTFAELNATGVDSPQGAMGADIGPWSNEMASDKEYTAWAEKYKAANKGAPPFVEPIFGYQTVKVLAEAIKRANSTDTEKVIDAIEQGFELSLPWGKTVMRGCDHQAYPPVWTGIISVDQEKKAAQLTKLEKFDGLPFARKCSEVVRK